MNPYSQYNPQDRKVAYFSMEVGLAPELPIYSGGLGILAGADGKRQKSVAARSDH